MPRAPRLNIADGIYHVISRGVRRHRIYEDAIDYRRFREMFTVVSKDFSWTEHVYCQMPNHFHFVSRPPSRAFPQGCSV